MQHSSIGQDARFSSLKEQFNSTMLYQEKIALIDASQQNSLMKVDKDKASSLVRFRQSLNLLYRSTFIKKFLTTQAISSVGRVSVLHTDCRQFNSSIAYHYISLLLTQEAFLRSISTGYQQCRSALAVGNTTDFLSFIKATNAKIALL